MTDPCRSLPCNNVKNAVLDSCSAVDVNIYTCLCHFKFIWDLSRKCVKGNFNGVFATNSAVN